MTDANKTVPAIATPKPRRRVVQAIPAELSAPVAPMPKSVESKDPKITSEPSAPKPAPKKSRKKAAPTPKAVSPKSEVPDTAPISKSFSVTLTLPADLYLRMTEQAEQYSMERAAFLKMLLKKDVAAFRDALDTLELKDMGAVPNNGPSETLNHPMRLTPAHYDKIKTALDPLKLRSMSANIADALLRYLNAKYS